MPRYIVGRYHKIGDEEFQAGQVLDLDADYAAWLSRDMQGHLTEIMPAQTPEPRAVEAPPEDRMVRKAKRRR